MISVEKQYVLEQFMWLSLRVLVIFRSQLARVLLVFRSQLAGNLVAFKSSRSEAFR